MTRLTEYILNRIKAIQSSDPHSGWRFESAENRQARINELDNLLAVMSRPSLIDGVRTFCEEKASHELGTGE